uniref:HAUS augmin-like complex subunit 3 N-terminal domain-containing protein n=1 Tax=Rhodosorus marinus TaxID=101924 RepID=A0A7S3ECJ9_9RHOD|mmetsp:Transcript_25032/g.98895  ORF Transcript_25032/g.98895 Transcript_25032/m.98895 type:complete len:472 (+) Transcript_25032:234-1649(+)
MAKSAGMTAEGLVEELRALGLQSDESAVEWLLMLPESREFLEHVFESISTETQLLSEQELDIFRELESQGRTLDGDVLKNALRALGADCSDNVECTRASVSQHELDDLLQDIDSDEKRIQQLQGMKNLLLSNLQKHERSTHSLEELADEAVFPGVVEGLLNAGSHYENLVADLCENSDKALETWSRSIQTVCPLISAEIEGQKQYLESAAFPDSCAEPTFRVSDEEALETSRLQIALRDVEIKNILESSRIEKAEVMDSTLKDSAGLKGGKPRSELKSLISKTREKFASEFERLQKDVDMLWRLNMAHSLSIPEVQCRCELLIRSRDSHQETLNSMEKSKHRASLMLEAMRGFQASIEDFTGLLKDLQSCELPSVSETLGTDNFSHHRQDLFGSALIACGIEGAGGDLQVQKDKAVEFLESSEKETALTHARLKEAAGHHDCVLLRDLKAANQQLRDELKDGSGGAMHAHL